MIGADATLPNAHEKYRREGRKASAKGAAKGFHLRNPHARRILVAPGRCRRPSHRTAIIDTASRVRYFMGFLTAGDDRHFWPLWLSGSRPNG